MALSDDDTTLVVANRDAGSVTVLRIDYAGTLPVFEKVAEISVGGEPWQVAIDACGERAYVALRRDAKLVEVVDLDTDTPTKGREQFVGSEPTGLALSPNNRRVLVANWVEGTISDVDAETMTLTGTLDLNAALLATGYLGTSVVTSRPALAHPRSIAITNDGDDDDDDETVAVTEFFAQRTAPEASPVAANADVNWVGLLYTYTLGQTAVSTVDLGALDTGFSNAAGATSCFPNQLQSVTVKGTHAYVTSICASPRGPLDVKTMSHPVVHSVDLVQRTSVSTNLNKSFDEFYALNGFAADSPTRRYPLIANELAFDGPSGAALLTANGVDAVFPVRMASNGAVETVGAEPTKPFVDLADPLLLSAQKGQNPLGLVVARAHRFAFVVNDVTRNVTAIDLSANAPTIAGLANSDARVTQVTALPTTEPDLAALRGKRAFNTGLDRWSLNGQGWGSCQSCHFEGLSDNITWYFARGPRQSTSLEGSFASNDPTDQRIFNWTGVFDEIADFENVARSLDGATGALVHTVSVVPTPADRLDLTSAALFPPFGAVGLNGSAGEVSANTSVVKTWADVEIYAQRVRSPQAPRGLAAADVAAGRLLFEGNTAGRCQGCHGDSKWTISKRFYMPGAATNEALKTTSYSGATLTGAGFPASLLPATPGFETMRFAAAGGDQIQCVLRQVGTFGTSPLDVNALELTAAMTAGVFGQGNATNGKGFNVPSLLGMAVGAPYFHAGNARTLEELLDAMFASHHRALSPTASFLDDPAEKAALVAFLLSIDESTTTVASPQTIGASGGTFCSPP